MQGYQLHFAQTKSSTWSLLVAVSRSMLKRSVFTHYKYRYDRLVSTTGSMDRVKSKPGRKRKMSTKDALGLFFYKTITLRHKKMAGRTTSAAIMVVFVFHSVLVRTSFFPAVLPHLMV